MTHPMLTDAECAAIENISSDYRRDFDYAVTGPYTSAHRLHMAILCLRASGWSIKAPEVADAEVDARYAFTDLFDESLSRDPDPLATGSHKPTEETWHVRSFHTDGRPGHIRITNRGLTEQQARGVYHGLPPEVLRDNGMPFLAKDSDFPNGD